MDTSPLQSKSLALLIFAFLIGVAVAIPVLYLLPVSMHSVERAREFGIISATVISGYPDPHESVIYIVGMSTVVLVGCLLWWTLSGQWREGVRRALLQPCRYSDPTQSAPRHRGEAVFAWLIFPLFLILLVFRWDFFLVDRGSWSFFAEEGFQLGWLNAALEGREFYRDIYCFNGPLMLYPALLALRIAGPTIEAMRAYVFALNVLGIVATYMFLLTLVRRRLSAYLAGLAMAVIFMPHWQHMDALSARFFLGLYPLFVMAIHLRTGRTWLLYAAGVLVGLCLFFSPEMGVSAAFGSTLMAISVPFLQGRGPRHALSVSTKVTTGAVAVVAVMLAFLASRGALRGFLNIMYWYPRFTMLGFATLPFPDLVSTAREFAAGRASGWALYSAAVAYVMPLTYAAFAVAVVALWCAGRFTWRTALIAGATSYGAVLFRAALARSDPGHFYLQPILVLVVLAGEDLVAAAFRSARTGLRASAVLLTALATVLFISLPAQAIVNNYASVKSFQMAMADRLGALAGRPSHLERLREAGYEPLALPRAPAALEPPEWRNEVREIVQFIYEHTEHGETVFVYPNSSVLYFLSSRPNATRFAMTYYAITAADRAEMLRALDSDPPRYAIWHGRTAGPEAIAEGIRSPEIQRFLQTRYRSIIEISPFTRILERKDPPP